MPSVDADNFGGGVAVARHLIDQGHRRIGCVNPCGGHVNHTDRLRGLVAEMRTSGLEVDSPHLLFDDRYTPDVEALAAKIGAWFDHLIEIKNVPTALFACDFHMAMATLGALTDRGIRVPKDISVAGFDDPPAAAKLDTPLTTVRQPVEEIGRLAVGLVLGAIDPVEPRPISGVVLPTELMIRASTSPV